MRKSLPKRDPLLLRMGAAKKRGWPGIRIGADPNSESGPGGYSRDISFQVDQVRLKAAEQRDGHYLLRSNLNRGRSGGVVGALCATDADREGFRSWKIALGISGRFVLNWSIARMRTCGSLSWRTACK
jgi:hypothetical protein